MLDQLGRGINGSLAYVGASRLIYKNRPDDSCPDASIVTDNGLVDYQTGLQFNVNGKRGWKIIVSLEPSDTYTVRLWHSFHPSITAKTGKFGENLEENSDVYCDMLADMVESMYDAAIQQYCGGFIRLA